MPTKEKFTATYGKIKIAISPDAKLIILICLNIPSPAKTPLNNRVDELANEPIKINKNM